MSRMKHEYQAEFEQFVSAIMKQYGAAGMAVSVIDKENTLYQKFFGYRDDENKLAIDENTVFGLASITKSFTCLAIMQLASKGMIDIDAPVSDYVPEFTGKNQKGLKVYQLMSHSGGFFPLKRIQAIDVAKEMGLYDPAGEDITYSEALAQKGIELVAARLDEQTRLIGKPGELMSYSNDSYGLLADIVRKYGGEKSYSAYVQKNILQPLSMTRSCLEFEKPAKDQNSAQLYIHRNGIREVSRNFYDNAFVLMGGGAMKSTIKDMKNYLRMYISEGYTPSGGRILDEYSIREMTKPRQAFRYQQLYGYGLSTKCSDDVTVIEHGGSLTGVSTNFSWSPQLGIGILVFCNTSDVPVIAVANAAMRWFNGRKPVADKDRWTDTPWTQEVINAACGQYVSGEGMIVDIFKRENGVGMLQNGQEVSVRMVESNVLSVAAPLIEYDLILCADAQGKVFGIRYKSRIIPKVS